VRRLQHLDLGGEGFELVDELRSQVGENDAHRFQEAARAVHELDRRHHRARDLKADQVFLGCPVSGDLGTRQQALESLAGTLDSIFHKRLERAWASPGLRIKGYCAVD